MTKLSRANHLAAGGILALAAALVALCVLVVIALVNAAPPSESETAYFHSTAGYEHPESVPLHLDAAFTAYAQALGGEGIEVRWDGDKVCGEPGEPALGCVWEYESAVVHLHPLLIESSTYLQEKIVAHEVSHALVWRRGIDIPAAFGGGSQPRSEHFAHCASAAVTDHSTAVCAIDDQELARALLGWFDGARIER